MMKLRDFLAYLWVYWNVADQCSQKRGAAIGATTELLKFLDRLIHIPAVASNNGKALPGADFSYYPENRCLHLRPAFINPDISNKGIGTDSIQDKQGLGNPETLFYASNCDRINRFASSPMYHKWKDDPNILYTILEGKLLNNVIIEDYLRSLFGLTYKSIVFLGPLVVGTGHGIWIIIADNEELAKCNPKDIANTAKQLVLSEKSLINDSKALQHKAKHKVVEGLDVTEMIDFGHRKDMSEDDIVNYFAGIEDLFIEHKAISAEMIIDELLSYFPKFRYLVGLKAVAAFELGKIEEGIAYQKKCFRLYDRSENSPEDWFWEACVDLNLKYYEAAKNGFIYALKMTKSSCTLNRENSYTMQPIMHKEIDPIIEKQGKNSFSRRELLILIEEILKKKKRIKDMKFINEWNLNSESNTKLK